MLEFCMLEKVLCSKKKNPTLFRDGIKNSSSKNRTYNMALEEPCYIHLTIEP